ncbi:Transcription factor [Aspergillus sp. HF37]|nr:Transcription factor [Aspergillus sp. HF37]
MPALSRGEFMELFYCTYSGDDRSPRTFYFLHIVFAIGAGITFDDRASTGSELSARSVKRRRVSSRQCQPLDYHASAIKCLGLSLESCDNQFCKLQELQAVILLAHFALLQPVAPGPAHLIEVAVRTAVNIDLYCEDESDAGSTEDSRNQELTTHQDRVRDLRRRLWWCAYSLDRVIAPYIGRPFSISDQVVTTEFPSMLEEHIPRGEQRSKHITHHYFKLRQLQSEIHEVLQYQRARAKASNKSNACVNALPSFRSFESFHSWRGDVNRRLDEWKRGIPEQRAGVCFPVVLLELDYWQTINLLYRQNIGVPARLDEMMPVTDPARCSADESQLEDSIYLKVAEASGKVLQLYRLLHHVRLVNYTYLAAHSIFLAGSSFLFTIWHSPLIRSQLMLNEIDYTLLAGTTILADMADRYPHAGSCRDTLEQMGAATMQMCLSTAEFSSHANRPCSPRSRTADAGCSSFSGRETQLHDGEDTKQVPTKRKTTQIPRFDMNLEGLLNGRDPNLKSRGPPRQSRFAKNHDHADSEESMSPISIPGSGHEQCSGTDMEPLMSLDLLEFDVGASDVLPFVGDGDLYQHTGSDGSIGEEAGNLGFGTAADPQQELVDAFLAV